MEDLMLSNSKTKIMKMTDYMQQYYQNERSTSYLAIAIGILFLLISFLLYYNYGFKRLQKGLSQAFIGAGLFFLLSGIVVSIYNGNKVKEATTLTKNDGELLLQEQMRIHVVLMSGYRSALILFSSLIIIGLIILLANSQTTIKGIGLGLLIIGTTGHITEAISMQKNKQYQEKISRLKF
jgi:hypothetical protein